MSFVIRNDGPVARRVLRVGIVCPNFAAFWMMWVILVSNGFEKAGGNSIERAA
jgi:hypothetical protein